MKQDRCVDEGFVFDVVNCDSARYKLLRNAFFSGCTPHANGVIDLDNL